MSDAGGPQKSSPHARMAIGLVGGVGLRVAANAAFGGSSQLDWIIRNLTEPAGQIFIRLLLMLVAPLLFSALVMGIAELEVEQLGKLGLRMMGYTVVVSAIAVA